MGRNTDGAAVNHIDQVANGIGIQEWARGTNAKEVIKRKGNT